MEQTMYMGGWFGRPYIFLRNCPEKGLQGLWTVCPTE